MGIPAGYYPACKRLENNNLSQRSHQTCDHDTVHNQWLDRERFSQKHPADFPYGPHCQPWGRSGHGQPHENTKILFQ